MLQFFRNYQKVIFLCTTVVIVISFLFFGTFSSLMSQQSQVKDVEIAKLLDGSSLKKRKVQMMAHFLSANLEDSRSGEKNHQINLFNDGVLEKDILGTTLGKQLAREFINECAEEVQDRWIKAVSFKSYVHPQAPFISAESVWTSFEPSLIDAISRIKKNRAETTFEAFSLLCDTYVKQRRVPAEMMRRILFYQQTEASWATKDPKLENTDLSLFGFHTAGEWLGANFIELTGQFIINAAASAKEQGLHVSKQEARISLMENLTRGMKMMSEDSLSPEELRNAFYQQIRILGVDESSCIELWQDVLLFRKLFQNADKIVKVDSNIALEQYALAKKVSIIDLYELPQAMRASDFRSMLKLQVYIDSVSTLKSRGDILSIPKEVLSLSEIEKRAPELIQKKYVVDYSEVKKQDILSEISLKQTWEWQLAEGRFSQLIREFPVLAKVNASTRSERFAALENLPSKQRSEVDLYAQNKILEENPQLIKQALQKAARKTKELHLSIKGAASPFALESHDKLMSFLDKAPLSSEGSPTAESIAAQQKLLCYTEDNVSYYSISVVSRDKACRLLTYAEANKNGILDQILSKRLEDAYPEAKRREPATYQTEKGKYKLLKEVQDLVGRFAFGDLLKAIEEQYSQYFGVQPTPQQKQSLSFYVTYRPLAFLKQAKIDVEIHPDSPKWVALSTSYQRDIDKQWLLVKSQRQVPMSEGALFISNKVLDMQPGSWSSILSLKNGTLSFFHLVGKEEVSSIPEAEEKKIKDLVLTESKKRLMADLLEKISEKGSIKPLPKESIAL